MSGECSICNEILDNSHDQVLLATCNHVFHIDCIVRWVAKFPAQRSTCPQCLGSMNFCNLRIIRSNIGHSLENVTTIKGGSERLTKCGVEFNNQSIVLENLEREFQRVKQQLEEEKERLLEEKKRLDEEMKRLDEEKKRLDEEKKRLDEEKKRLDEERKRLDEEKKLLEERVQRLEEKVRYLEEQQRIEKIVVIALLVILFNGFYYYLGYTFHSALM